MNSGGSILDIDNLAKDFDTAAGVIRVLKGVNLTIHKGESVALLGPSGSGKSTLLFIIGLLLSHTAGRYALDGQDVTGMDEDVKAAFRRHYFGFVFQSCNLIENSTVFEDLEYPLIYAGVPHTKRRSRIHEALERVQMSHRIHHRTNLLSGGEQQRVAVARALINRPHVILADEPTGQLDSDNSQNIVDLFMECLSDGQTSLILVTHDHKVAERCRKVYRLGEGILKATA
jgi:putative ABC transport system ATP-binding protein